MLAGLAGTGHSDRLPGGLLSLARRLVLVACAALVACGGWPDAPRPIVHGEGFFDAPFPDDRRLKEGHPDLSAFPFAGELEIIADYAAESSKLDGYGTQSPIFVRFDEPLDLGLLPEPAESTWLGSNLMLVDIDPTSPERGRRVPVTWDFQADETRWQPDNFLAVAPVWGRPLRAATTYALVFGRAVVRPPDGFEAVWTPGHPDHTTYQPLHELLFEWRIDTDDIGYAVVFTTQDPTSELARIVYRTRSAMDAPTLPAEVEPWYAGDGYLGYTGKLRVPWWQHGEAPYTFNGGDFLFEDDGWPVLSHLDEATFGLAVPRSDMPLDGFPLVVFIHGTGSSWASFFDGTANDVAAPLAQAGIASISISLPFHGDRSVGNGGEALMSFNVLNATAGRTNMRQAATEAVWLTDMFIRAPQSTVGRGREIRFDPSRVAYMGHSHGAVLGSIALPYFHPEVRGVVLSGAGGGVSLSAVGRDAGDIDIQALLEQAVGLDSDEVLDTHHPVIGLLQLLAETTDPLNYAPHWHHIEPSWAATPRSVLMFEGDSDIYTPPDAIEALAGAARVPVLDELVRATGALSLPGVEVQDSPAELNAKAWDDTAVTAGLLQYEGAGHFVIFEDQGARDAYVGFLETALSTTPRIER